MCMCRDIGIRSEGILKVRAKGESRTDVGEGERGKKINKPFFKPGIFFFLSVCVPLINKKK